MEHSFLMTQNTLPEIERLIKRAMDERVGPLQEEVQLLREQIRAIRPVITHKIAPLFFDEEVEPNTVIEYIKFRGLPAYKNGRRWFLYLKDLMDWQIGRIGYPERTSEIVIIEPQHPVTFSMFFPPLTLPFFSLGRGPVFRAIDDPLQRIESF